MTAATDRPLGLYLHIPFCARKCAYCDFNTYAGMEALFEPFVQALCRELELAAEVHGDREVDTVFIGGGTPTVLAPGQLARILERLRSVFHLRPDAEITVEANPGSGDRERFRVLADQGVQRVSIGGQSFQDDELRFLGRIHGPAELALAVEAARAAGIARLNLDLIFGLPGQALASWERSLEAALALAPEHLSLYSLIVEEGTPLAAWVADGRVAAPDPDLAADHYTLARERLGAAGYVHYEVSNWALAPADGAALGDWETPPAASRHNLRYWRNQDYLGLGPGAHGALHQPAGPGRGHRLRRWWNLRPVPDYLRRLSEGRTPEEDAEEPDGPAALGETMMLGLRLLREGLAWAEVEALHGIDARRVYADTLAELQGWGLIEGDGRRLRLSARGLPVGNQVFCRFLP